MDKVLGNNIEKIKNLCANRNVKSLFVFGSVCTDKFKNSSDIDLLISFNPMDYADYADNYFLIADEFEKILQRPVDLITDKSLSNPYLINSINKTKTLLYEKRD